MRSLILSILALLLQASAVPAQQQSAKGSIEGVVLRAGTNEPIAGAEVAAFSSLPAMPSAQSAPRLVLRTISDSKGRFAIQNVDSGGYRISVSANGYARMGAEAEPGVNLAGAAAIRDLVIRLIPAGVVSGRVASVNGEPLLGMEVVILRLAYDSNGWRSFEPMVESVRTDDRGEYRVSSLAPGRYYVRAGRSAWDNSNMASMGTVPILGKPGESSPGKYQTIYYPDKTDPSAASLVEVQEGGERSGVNFTLSRQPTYRIRGRVIDPSATQPPSRAMIGVNPLGIFASMVGISVAPYKADGTFELVDLTPGAYEVSARLELTPEQRQLLQTPGGPPQLPVMPRALAVVEVKDSDVENVELTIVRDLSVSGRLSVEGQPLTTLVGFESLKVELGAVRNGRLEPFGVATVDSEGRFIYKNLPLTEYLVTLAGLPPDAYIKEGRLGDIDVLTQTFRLTRPVTESLNIVLAAKGGQINGTITDSSATPVANAQTVLIPDGLQNRPDRYKTATTDSNGRFTLRGVAPGDYKLFAWETIERYRYFDPDFGRQFEGNGTAVHVSDSSTITANTKLIPARP